jgi:hypothetical protein
MKKIFLSVKKIYLLAVLLGCMATPLALNAAEYTDGRIRLVLHEGTGRFSLYYMTDIASGRYEPFFVDQDPRTSFLSVIFNDHSYRLGETSVFRSRLGGTQENPALVFESSFLQITEEFSFIRTADSVLTNGVGITIKIENRSSQQAAIGTRFLLDTNLGEGTSQTPFITNTRSITSEFAIEPRAENGEKWWISRNDRLSLMGSVSLGENQNPDFIHFANWKRLNDVPWKTAVSQGRNFNFLPYSIGDSAVCYYFEPVLIGRGETVNKSILLAAGDEKGFTAYNNTAGAGEELSRILQESASPQNLQTDSPENENAIRTDLILLRDLIARLDEYINNDSVTADELTAIELVINRLKARYGLQ